MSERSGVEIDYCPQCRGVWLDRGELDKIIARSVEEPSPPDRRASTAPLHAGDLGSHHGHGDGLHYRGAQRPREKSIWQELFD